MAESHVTANVQALSLKHDKEVLELELQDRERKVELLSKSNGQLAVQVQQLKAMIKDAHVRYEGDLQRTVASLQDQYNSALEVIQLGACFAAPSQLKAEPHAVSKVPPAAATGGTASASSCGCCTGAQRPTCSRPTPPQQPLQQQQPRSSAPGGATCKGHRGGACRRCPCTVAPSCCAKQQQAGRQSSDMQDLSSLGIDVEHLTPSAAYGATVGLITEPLAVLRDVLNLDGSRDRERDQRLTREGPLLEGTTPVAGDPAGLLLAQAHFESRIRGAYRSMLLQLQHRYQLERERQEDVHKLALQEQGERHDEELQQLAAAQEADLTEAARRMEQQEAAWKAEVQRLETALEAAKAVAETSQSQAAAARAQAESLQAQLQLQRATHEAELQHVRQGSMSLEEHEQAVRRLKTDWDQALQQRERDYSALLSELAGLRRQLSSSANDQSQSSGNSCGRGSTIVSPPAVAVGGQPPPPPAAGPAQVIAASVQPVHQPQMAASVYGRAIGGRSTDGRPYQPAGEELRWALDGRQLYHYRQQLQQDQQQQQPSGIYQHGKHARCQSHNDGRRQQGEHHPSCQPHQQQQHQHQPQRGNDEEASDVLAQDVLVVTGSGLRVRWDPASGPGSGVECGGDGDDGGGGGGGGGGGCSSSSRPVSPAGSAHSAAASLDGSMGSVDLNMGGDNAAATPRSNAHRGQDGGATVELLAPPASSSSSRLSALVGAVVSSSSARRGLAMDCAAAAGADATLGPTAAANPAVITGAVLEAYTLGANSGGGHHGCGSSGGGDLRTSGGAFEIYPQQPRQQQHEWHDRGSGSGDLGGGGRGGGGNDNNNDCDSLDHPNSEVTLGRWQPAAPPADTWDSVGGLTVAQPQGPPRCGSAAAAAAPGPVAPRFSEPPQRPAARDRGGFRAAEPQAAASRTRSPSPSPPSSPRRVGRCQESSWGRTGNPAAAVVLPRCLRCGLNDATSPGCCRFHPALLSQPGSLRFTPEWMTCQAAGHTTRTPGCFVRSEHFYELPGLMPQPVAAAPQWVRGSVEWDEVGADGGGSGGGGGGGAGGNGGGGGLGTPALRNAGRHRASGGGAGQTALAQAPAGCGPMAAAPVKAALRRSSMSRSPLRDAARQRAPSAGRVRVGSGGGSDSPSPKPRTRLPSPMRR